MVTSTAAAPLEAWEQGTGRIPIERLRDLLVATGGGPDPDTLTIGERELELLSLRACLFGPLLVALAECPSCAGAAEFEVTVDELRQMAGGAAPASPVVDVAGTEVRVRPVRCADVMAVVTEDPVDPVGDILAHCTVGDGNSDHDGGPAAAAVRTAVIDALAAADPAADLRVGLTCPDCGHAWAPGLDVGAFLWDELTAWAQQTLGEVDALAAAYGWSEAEILALTPQRRWRYLELVQG